jgi:hypothetical protein
LSKLLKKQELAHGKQGIFFAETGHHTWLELSQGVAAAGYELGALKTDKVKSVTVKDVPNWAIVELAYASKYDQPAFILALISLQNLHANFLGHTCMLLSSRTRSDRSRPFSLGGRTGGSPGRPSEGATWAA